MMWKSTTADLSAFEKWVALNKIYQASLDKSGNIVVPILDIVGVIRCEHCKYSKPPKDKEKGLYWCKKFKRHFTPDYYCASAGAEYVE